MGSYKEPEFVDTGTAPEFFVDDIGRHELVAGGNVRRYMCARRGNLLIVQYYMITPVSRLAVMAQRDMTLALQYNAQLHRPSHGGDGKDH